MHTDQRRNTGYYPAKRTFKFPSNWGSWTRMSAVGIPKNVYETLVYLCVFPSCPLLWAWEDPPIPDKRQTKDVPSGGLFSSSYVDRDRTSGRVATSIADAADKDAIIASFMGLKPETSPRGKDKRSRVLCGPTPQGGSV